MSDAMFFPAITRLPMDTRNALLLYAYDRYIINLGAVVPAL